MATPSKKKSSSGSKMYIRVCLDAAIHPYAFQIMEATPARGRSKRLIEIAACSAHTELLTSLLAAHAKQIELQAESIFNNRERELESDRVLRNSMLETARVSRESLEKTTEMACAFHTTIAQVNSAQRDHTNELTTLLQRLGSLLTGQISNTLPTPSLAAVTSERDYDVSLFAPALSELSFSANA